jgi:hypothetical protein
MRRSIFNRGIMATENQEPQLEDPTNAPVEGGETPPAEGGEGSTPPVAGEGGEGGGEGGGETPPVEGGETPPVEGGEGGETPPAEGGEGDVPPVEGGEGGEGDVPPVEGGEAPPMENGMIPTEPVDTIEDELDDVPDHAESAEADLADINAERGEIDAADDAIGEAEDSVEALEAIRDALIEADKEGGLSRGGANVLRVSLEHIYGRLGLPTEKVTPALESFGGHATRQSSTQIAIESLSETAANIWKKIVEWAKKIWDWIVGWYKKLFDMNTKYKARAEALKQAVATVAKAQKKQEEIENAGLAKSLSFASGPNFEETVTSLDHFVKQFNGGATKYFGSIKKLIESVKDGKNPGAQNAEAYSFGLQKEATVEGVEAPDGAAMFASPELPGRVRIVSVWSEANIEHCQFKKIDLPQEGEHAKLPVLDAGAIEKAADLVLEITNAVAASRSGLDEAGAAFKELMAAAESNINGTPDGQEGENVDAKTAGHAKLAIARKAQELLKDAATQVNHYLVTTAGHVVGWGELSAKAYGTPEAGGEGEGGAEGGEGGEKTIGEKVGEAAGKAGEAVKTAAGKVGEAAGKAGSAVSDAAAKVGGKVTSAVDAAKSKLSGTPSAADKIAEQEAAEKRAKLKEQAKP